MPSVVQEWVEELPLMMQGTMMTGVRGNDIIATPKLKPLVRWVRSLILVQGNPENDFMEVDVTTLPTVEHFEDELEYLSVHYFRHLLHTIEIIGYKHPDYDTSMIAIDYYLRLVDWCHLAPETHEELNERLSGEPGTTGKSKTWKPDYPIFNRKKKPSKKPVSSKPVPVPPVHQNYGGDAY
jgi:hypothetical protein